MISIKGSVSDRTCSEIDHSLERAICRRRTSPIEQSMCLKMVRHRPSPASARQQCLRTHIPIHPLAQPRPITIPQARRPDRQGRTLTAFRRGIKLAQYADAGAAMRSLLVAMVAIGMSSLGSGPAFSQSYWTKEQCLSAARICRQKCERASSSCMDSCGRSQSCRSACVSNNRDCIYETCSTDACFKIR